MNRSKSIENRLNSYSNRVLDTIAREKGIKNTWDSCKTQVVSSLISDSKPSENETVTDRMEWLMKQPLKKLNELFLQDKLSDKETTHIYENRSDVRKVYNTWIKDYIFKYVMSNINNNR